MRRRRHVGEVELGHLRDGLEDRAQLLREALDLLVGQVEPREPRHVEDFVSADRHGKSLLENEERGPLGPRSQRRYERVSLDRGDVRGLQALVALHDLELHALTLGQRAVALRLDRRVMDEDVVAVLTLDESVALLVRKPLDGALRQSFLLENRTTARAPRAAEQLQQRAKP